VLFFRTYYGLAVGPEDVVGCCPGSHEQGEKLALAQNQIVSSLALYPKRDQPNVGDFLIKPQNFKFCKI